MSASCICSESSRLRRTARSLVGASLLFFVCPGAAPAQMGLSSSDLLEDQLEKLAPKQVRSEADQDRLLAAAQFAYGRMLLQREQLPAALARFQRSFRQDPSPAIARQIIAIASELNRHDEAVRYAVLSAEIEPPDGDFAVRLAALLAEKGDHRRAIRVLENTAQRATKPPTGLNAILLRAELMRLYLLTEQFESAAKAADAVREALDQPGRSGLPASDQQKLTGQRDRLDPLIAECFLRTQRYADAEAVFRSIHQVRPNEALLGFNLARIAADQKNWKTARERLELYFGAKATVAGFESYELLGQIIAGDAADETRAKADTLTALIQLRERDPKNTALGYFTAARLLAADDLDAAAKLYEDLLSRQPTTTAYRNLAQVYRRKRDPAALLQLIGRAVDQAGSRELFDAEGDSLAKDAALFEQLVAHLRNPDKVQPDKVQGAHSASAFVGVSLLALGAGKLDVARELYEKALAVPEADLAQVRETVGLAALLADQHRFAAEIFQQAIEAKPPQDKLAAYYFYLSGALEFAGETDGALAAADKCALLKRDSAQFQSRSAWVLYHAKRLDQAEQRYRDLLVRFDMKFESDEVRDQMRQTRLILSNICVLKERLPEAEEWLEQVLDEFPENIGALNDLGYLWADQGKRLQRALRMVEQVVAADSDNAAYRDSLGWAFYRLGRYSDAVRELERAAAGEPDGVIYDHLGDAYLKLDQRAKALEAWRKGIELMQGPHEAKQRANTTAKIKEHSDSKNADSKNAKNADPKNADPKNTDPKNTDPKNTDPKK